MNGAREVAGACVFVRRAFCTRARGVGAGGGEGGEGIRVARVGVRVRVRACCARERSSQDGGRQLDGVRGSSSRARWAWEAVEAGGNSASSPLCGRRLTAATAVVSLLAAAAGKAVDARSVGRSVVLLCTASTRGSLCNRGDDVARGWRWGFAWRPVDAHRHTHAHTHTQRGTSRTRRK